MTGDALERSLPSSRVGAAREARYAEAIVASDGDVLGRRAIDTVARAVMAVADEEQDELQAEVERLGTLAEAYRTHLESLTVEHHALIADLRGLADSKGSGFPYVQTRELRTVLDKHAGEQAQGGDGA